MIAMGGKNVKLTKKDINDLSQATYFTKREIRKWYKDFIIDCPEGTLKREGFQAIYQQLFPFGDPQKFANYVFNVFDFEHKDIVTFREFMIALSTVSRGTKDEKLEWAFRLYDLNGDRFISRTEMMQIVDAIYTMIGSTIDLPLDEDTPEKRVDKIFKLMDQNRDGKLSLDEFKEGCLCDPWVAQIFDLRWPATKQKISKS